MRGGFVDTADDGQLHHRGAGRAADVSSDGGGDDGDINAAEAERIRLEIDKLQMKLQSMQDNYLKSTGIKFDPVSGKREERSRSKARLEMNPQAVPLGTWMFLAFCGVLFLSAVAMQIMSFYKIDFSGRVNDFFGLDLERAKRDLGFHHFEKKGKDLSNKPLGH